jgi:hypothetical protein
MRYLLITFFRKPGGQIDEQVGTSKKLKATDRQMCNVILDFANKKVEKCVIEGKVVDMDWDKVNQYYKKIYPAIIAQLEKEADITSKEKSK